jgi:pimeloyl-ACP methyl ester carboxylesterase/sugar lactone lactonase YvrE
MQYRILVLALAAAARVPAADAAAQQADTARDLDFYARRAMAAYRAHDYRGYLADLTALRRLAPRHPTVLYYAAAAHALNGQPNEALALLRAVARFGGTQDPTADSDFVSLRALPAFRQLADSFARNRRPVSHSTEAFVLPDPDLLPEALAYDSADGSFYVGSLAQRKVIRRHRDGRIETVAGPGAPLLRVVGVKIDGLRRQLWFATWEPGIDSASTAGLRVTHTRLFRYDLRSGQQLKSYAPRDSARGHLLNDLVVTPDGDVYVTDTEEGSVYRVRRNADTLELFVRPDPARFSGANGIAVAADGRTLYVAFAQGIARLDLASRELGLLGAPEDVTTSGIDGLYWHPTGLIAVQTAGGLERVVRFELDASGRRVRRSVVLERANPLFRNPTTGILVGDTLYYIANSQYSRLADDNTLRDSEYRAPTHVLRVDVTVVDRPGRVRPRRGLAPVNGTTLYYEMTGSGPPVVLLEGANLELHMWDPQVAALARRHTVVRYDVRGFGRSGPTGAPYRASDDLFHLLRYLGLPRASLVGLSLGGRIALDFAVEHPEMVDRLVLAGPGLSGFPWSRADTVWARGLEEAAAARDPTRAVERWLRTPYMAPTMAHAPLAPRVRALAMRNLSSWLQPESEQPISPPAIRRLERIRAPLLAIVGTRDHPDIGRIVDTLVARVPGARRLVFESAGHLTNLEQPARFNRAVLEFLGEARP